MGVVRGRFAGQSAILGVSWRRPRPGFQLSLLLSLSNLYCVANPEFPYDSTAPGLVYNFVRLHPLLGEIEEHRGNVEQDHEGAGDRQGEDTRLGRTRFDDRHRLVVKVCARVAAQIVVLVLIAKVQDEDLLRDIHLLLLLLLANGRLVAAHGTTLPAPGLD